MTLLASIARADAAAEVTAALEKLHSTTYRQRDILPTMPNVPAGLMAPVVTEHASGRTRLVSEVKHPSVGVMRTERITVGERAAVRTRAPVLLAKLEETKRKLTVSTAKNLLQQIISAAAAVQTGGLSTASWIMEATRAATSLKTTADARVALDAAMAGFQGWQLVKEDEDSELPPMPAGMPMDSTGDRMAAEKLPASSQSVISYRRTPIDTVAGMNFYSVLTVDAKTGYPLAEENFVNGQRMMRSEYFDVGANIEIEIPDCLK